MVNHSGPRDGGPQFEPSGGQLRTQSEKLSLRKEGRYGAPHMRGNPENFAPAAGGQRRAIIGMNLELHFPLPRRRHAFRPPSRIRQGGAAPVGGK